MIKLNIDGINGKMFDVKHEIALNSVCLGFALVHVNFRIDAHHLSQLTDLSCQSFPQFDGTYHVSFMYICLINVIF